MPRDIHVTIAAGASSRVDASLTAAMPSAVIGCGATGGASTVCVASYTAGYTALGPSCT